MLGTFKRYRIYAWSLTVLLVAAIIGSQLAPLLTISGHQNKFSFWSLYGHNLLLAVVLLLGSLTYGILSSLVVLVNGLVLGAQAMAIYDQLGYEVLVRRVLAHGVFEVPAIVISAGFGFYLLEKKLAQVPINWRQYGKHLVANTGLVALLLLVAACIEVVMQGG